MKRILSVLAISLCMAACSDSSSSPAAPSSPYPRVAGNYTGSVTFSYSSLASSLTCPATTTVTQTDATVTFAPLTIAGSCGTTFPSFPLGSFTLSTDGSLGSSSQNGIFVASCNGVYNATESGSFSGSSFKFSLTYTAAGGGCLSDPGNFAMTIALAK
jgi:hypothetical protein